MQSSVLANYLTTADIFDFDSYGYQVAFGVETALGGNKPL